MLSSPGLRVHLIAAVADNGVIGSGADIPWHLPADFAHFKRTTLDHALIMGRTTYEAIGRPLPGRHTIVVTRQRSWQAAGLEVAHSLGEAYALAAQHYPNGSGTVFIAGGGEIYHQTLVVASELILTRVHACPPGDVFFPAWDPQLWLLKRRAPYPAELAPDGGQRPAFTIEWYLRQRSAGRQAPPT